MTFSLVGRCARTGQLGAVVTTSAIGVGARCQFARAGVGAVLTQHRTDPRLGPMMLEMMARGLSAPDALRGTIAGTPHRDWRQVAAIDAAGRTAAFTGAKVRPAHGEAEGRDCVGIGNIIRDGAMPQAMVAAFEADPAAPLATRLISAIQAGEAAGGEIAAVASAALLVVDRETFPFVDLRVDAHATPLDELARLWSLYEPQAEDYVARAVDPDRASHYVAPPAKILG
ncbi:MAG: DUF1028 domain-containing protein [Alphaproteobacteria bacterium]|nr:DUF1028 domain-containing protein [Alphaproteobacteria bacterium]